MRVSCSFVVLAVFFAVESQCAPLNPLNVVNQLGGHLQSNLRSAPIAHNVLSSHVLGNQVDAVTPVHQLGGDAEGALQSAPITNDILSGNLIKKRQLGLPLSGLTSIVPGTPSVDSLPGLSSLPSMSSVPGLSSLPSMGAVPGLSSLPAVGSLPALNSLPTKGALPGLSSLPSTSSLPGVKTLPSVSSLPSLPALNSLPSTGAIPDIVSIPGVSSLPIPGLNTKRGLGSMFGSLPANNLPLIGGGGAAGVPIVNSPFDALNGFLGSAGGDVNPLTSML